MREYHYWIGVTEPESGRFFLVYGGRDEAQSRTKALEMLGSLDFQLKRLPTRDMATASRLWKGGRLDSTHDLRQSTQRIGHDRSLRSMINKRREQRAARYRE